MQYRSCDCDSPGYCERLNRQMVGRKWELCQQRADYRALWDMQAGLISKEQFDRICYRTPSIKPKPYRATTHNLQCVYLGSELPGQDGCRTCRRRDCEIHGITSLKACKLCPYAATDPMSIPPQLIDWAVGITTAPGRDYLRHTFASLLNAGFHNPTLFAEPDSLIPREAEYLETVRLSKRIGAYRNFYNGLIHLIEKDPAASAYLMSQDDVIYSRGLRGFLTDAIIPDGILTLAKSSAYRGPENQWVRVKPHKKGIVGAWSLVFPNDIAKAFVESDLAANWPDRWDHRDKAYPSFIDGLVGMWAKQNDVSVWTHTPSLAQHIGKTSTLNHAFSPHHMKADDFVEDILAQKI